MLFSSRRYEYRSSDIVMSARSARPLGCGLKYAVQIGGWTALLLEDWSWTFNVGAAASYSLNPRSAAGLVPSPQRTPTREIAREPLP